MLRFSNGNFGQGMVNSIAEMFPKKISSPSINNRKGGEGQNSLIKSQARITSLEKLVQNFPQSAKNDIEYQNATEYNLSDDEFDFFDQLTYQEANQRILNTRDDDAEDIFELRMNKLLRTKI